MTELLSDTDTPSDAELISRVRGGDVAAYGELFSRHVQAANRLARQLVRGPDADDLVSDAFAKVLGVLQAGGGPDVAFRAYLLTAVRRLQVDRVRAGSRLQTSDDMSQFDPGIPFQDTAVSGFESGAAARAFASLPERWQLVLWHLEVEGQKPADIAPLLGMSPNSVSALAYRAREGLRQAFLTMHLSDISADSCRWVNEHLGAYVRHGLARRDAAKVEDHLQECRRCTAMYLELTEVNSDLRAIIAPLLLGAAATGYLASTGSAGSAGALALVGRVRDVILAHAGVAATGATAAGVAAVATTAVLLTQGHPDVVVGADRPIAATTRIAPSSGSAAPSSRPSSGGGPTTGAGGPAGSGSTASAGALAIPVATSSSTSTPAGAAPGAGTTPGTGTVPGTGPGLGTSAGPVPGSASDSPGAPGTSPAGQKSGGATPAPGSSHSSPGGSTTPGGSTGPGGSPGTPTPSPTHRPTTTPTSGQTATPSPGNNGSTGSPGDPTSGDTSGSGGSTGGPSTGPTTPPSTGGTETPGSGSTGGTGGGSGDTGGSVSAAFAPLVAPTAPDGLGRFVVPMDVTGLPEGVDSLTFTVAPVSNQIGLSQFTVSTMTTFADAAPTALSDGAATGSGPSCTLTDPTTLVCTSISGPDVTADFPVTVDPLETTKVKITATGEGVSATSDPVIIDPPTADVALSELSVSSVDNGNYHVTGTVTGIPADYQFLSHVSYTIASDDPAVASTPVSATTTCPSSDDSAGCVVNLVVAANGIADDTPVTVTVGSLPGYIDGNDPTVNNYSIVKLEAPTPPAKGLDLEISNPTHGSGSDQINWTFDLKVTGATPNSVLTFALKDSNGSSVTFDAAPPGCTTADSAAGTFTCIADAEGSFASTLGLKLPNGQSQVELRVTDPISDERDSAKLIDTTSG
jgi:RNA polymerase sigma factor (sigma-70 family)